jgi:Ser/Thr protein kinase RdoA (MazF antagonist)
MKPSENPEFQHPVIAIAEQFAVQGRCIEIEEIITGHINSTYCATFLQDDGNTRRFILQAINGHVFQNPYAVMRNVETVTRHINARVLRVAKHHSGQTLNLYPTRSGDTWIAVADGTLWRCYNFIEGCMTFDIVENPELAYQAAYAFGSFQDLVSDLDARLLTETIPDFHNTQKRLQRLLEVTAADSHQRLESVITEFQFILNREMLIDLLPELVATGKIPIRVTHNDTKINNVMIDAKSDKAICVIDLDTVMPGLALYDFGDLVRSASNPAAEDEQDLSKVRMDMILFQALVKGYLDSAGNFLNSSEIAHLVHAAKLLTLELAIRFLTDYLEGDLYFKTQRPNHNLDRARTQIKLIKSMEAQESEMQAFVAQYAATA